MKHNSKKSGATGETMESIANVKYIIAFFSVPSWNFHLEKYSKVADTL
jgi:hypothetical protein